jgi:hypothetical protein
VEAEARIEHVLGGGGACGDEQLAQERCLDALDLVVQARGRGEHRRHVDDVVMRRRSSVTTTNMTTQKKKGRDDVYEIL